MSSAHSNWYLLVDTETGEPPELPTRFRLTLQPHALHVEIVATCERLWSPHARRNDPIYQADALELFLDPVGGGRLYRELEVSPTGAVFDAWISNRTDLGTPGAPRRIRGSFPRLEPGSPHVAVLIDGRPSRPEDRAALRVGRVAMEWSAHWTIPLATHALPEGSAAHGMLGALSANTSPLDWRMNVARIQHRAPGEPPNLQTWRPTGLRDFHRPDVFAPLPV